MSINLVEPPKNPSREDCRDALAKGLGRARLWAEAGVLNLDELRWACVHDLRYDQQCEDSRADWVWMLIERSGAVDACEKVLWEAVCELPDERSAHQVCQLTMRYGLIGRERFTQRLLEIVREKPIDGDLTLGEYELMVAAGMDGFIPAVNKRGERLGDAEWEWDDDSFVSQAIELFGEATIQETLSSSNDSNVKRFQNHWQSRKPASDVTTTQVAHRDRMRAIAVEEVFAASRTEDRCSWFRGWGIHADASDIEAVLDRILDCEDTDELSRLLKVFSRRELVRIELILFNFCRSSHADLAFAAFRALEGNSHRAIRSFALERLRLGDLYHAAELLTSNYEAGDERLIVDAITIPDDTDNLHGLLMACRSFLEANEGADADPLALLIYQQTPCSLCRTAAVKTLQLQDKVPAWMIDEIRFDCDEGTRQLCCPQPDHLSLLLSDRLDALQVTRR